MPQRVKAHPGQFLRRADNRKGARLRHLLGKGAAAGEHQISARQHVRHKRELGNRHGDLALGIELGKLSVNGTDSRARMRRRREMVEAQIFLKVEKVLVCLLLLLG